jgi:hypothetical protein
MRWLAAIACILSLLIAGPAGTKPGTPVDESDTELVKSYIHFPCDALEESYEFQYDRLMHLTGHLVACHREAKEPNDYKYPWLMCMYVEIEWKLVYSHSKSVEKAWYLMCDSEGQRRQPEYEIEF